MKTLLLVAAVCAFACPSLAADAHPQWAVRVSYDGANHVLDEPSCHALPYFQKDTAELIHHHVMVHVYPGKTKDETASLAIGVVDGWKVLQVTHNISDGTLYLRLLLVERKPGEFCEIYHQEYMGGDSENPYDVYREVLPAYLVKTGTETLIAVRDPVNGNGNEFDENYWSFDKSGPIDLCVYEAIREITKTLLPENWAIVIGDGFKVESLTYAAAPLERSTGRYGTLRIPICAQRASLSCCQSEI
jgi:hypothetical protein